MKGERRPDYLYVATDGELMKIGISDNPERRRGQLGPNTKLVKFWHRTCPVVRDVEAYIKDRFHDRCAHGEWFAVSEEEMMREAARAVRIEDDDLAIFFGREPSRRCDQPFVPPSELPWLKNVLRG